jgi:hypothetical protein
VTQILLGLNILALLFLSLFLYKNTKQVSINSKHSIEWHASSQIAAIILDILTCERTAIEYHMSLRKSALETELLQRLNLISHRLSSLVSRLERLEYSKITLSRALELQIKQKQAITYNHWGDTHLNYPLSPNHEIVQKIKASTIDLITHLNSLDISLKEA